MRARSGPFARRRVGKYVWGRVVGREGKRGEVHGTNNKLWSTWYNHRHRNPTIPRLVEQTMQQQEELEVIRKKAERVKNFAASR